MDPLFIPSLSHWQLGNYWSGSLGRASYHVTPREREDGDEKIAELYAEIWTGPTCYELSTAEITQTFPITQEGLGQLHDWLLQTLAQVDEAARQQEENSNAAG
jgi:hypothetical protein